MTEPDDIAALHAHLAWPRGRDLAAADLPAWLDRLARAAAARGAIELGELATAVVRDPDSPDRLYDLGYALIDAGAPSIAASVLWRCLALVGESEEVVCELVSALESALAYGDAFAILEARAELRARSFLCRYLYAFDAAMTGRLAVTRAVLAELAADSIDTAAMRATIEGIVERADRVAGACSLDGADLRGWHYVIAGGLLLHQSPYGFDAPMRGRYAYLRDSLDRVAFGIDRLVALVRAAGAAPPCVYAPPGPGHDAVARALAARLEVPVAPWPAVGSPAPGIVALYDLAQLPPAELPRLVHRRAGQILFAHASPWTRDCPIAPDVTTLLYQTLDPPESFDELATHASLADDELAADEPARFDALVARAWPLAPGTRTRLYAGGPVASNRFV
ncbi:MAG TPA: hypothetical protein VMJ10_01185 [Kofleriaceae bacterium]|nr:hypothetical protein [Kofleriaceae bacterium]